MASFMSTLSSMSTLLSAYASLSATVMLFRAIWSEMGPDRIRDYISSKLTEALPNSFFPKFTFIIDEHLQAASSQTFRAVEAYLTTIIAPSVDCLLVGSYSLDPHDLEESIPVGSKIIDEFHGMKLEWSLLIVPNKSLRWERRFFRLKCKRSDREKVKEEIINDLNAFGGRRDLFQRVGRPWKRVYLLHGPPGTGKSSLVAAIANHLRYNIYDLQLQSVGSDAELRRLLTSTTSRSILLVENIDCSTQASRDRTKIKCEQEGHGEDELAPRLSSPDPGITFSGLLNSIDGLWSSCGDEKVIIFTTYHKDKLDPALLRPGRMDFNVYMGYCTFAAFTQLANAYLQIGDHDLFSAIKDLLKRVSVTPAEVAQQLMNTGEPQAILESLIGFLEETYVFGNGRNEIWD